MDGGDFIVNHSQFERSGCRCKISQCLVTGRLDPCGRNPFDIKSVFVYIRQFRCWPAMRNGSSSVHQRIPSRFEVDHLAALPNTRGGGVRSLDASRRNELNAALTS